ncbi:MAG: T9SS type A sorting domain-containing protein [Bacteroidetes bacterium]|nr:T9SS type A sorting domain-containing protein [Bacteroidota bacterium]
MKSATVKKSVLIMLFFVSCFYVSGQFGIPDTTFGDNGIVTTAIRYPGDDQANYVAVQPDGKILVAGYTMETNFLYDFLALRYNPDGSLDSTFGVNGIAITPIGSFNNDDAGFDAILKPDGKLLIAGGSSGDFALMCLNTDGSLDNSFGINGVVVTDFYFEGDVGYSLAIQSDGKTIVGGVTSTTCDSTRIDFALLRYYPDGSIDTTFGDEGRVITIISNDDDWAYSVSVQSDEKIILNGYANEDFAIVRYNTDGSIDSTFGTTGVIFIDYNGDLDRSYSSVIQEDDKIIVAGTSASDFAMVRLNSDGTPDNTFGISGKVTVSITDNDTIYHTDFEGVWASLQSDGKILLTSGVHHDPGVYGFVLARFNTDGTLDNTFGTNGIAITPIGTGGDYGKSIAIQADGYIVVAGFSYNDSGIYGAQDEIALVRYVSGLGSSILEFDCKQEDLLIYPNPTTGKFTVDIENIEKIEIYNIKSQLVCKTTKNEIDISNQPVGVYFIKISTEMETITGEIIKK